MKYAAIDIGSNAMRLLVANVVEGKKGLKHKKSSLVRVPIRLGEDVFTGGAITPEQQDRMINAMKAYWHLMIVHKVEKYRACATSALRESSNGQEVIKNILEASGIQIDLISGEEEARIIYSTHIEKLLGKNDKTLYVDVGGGSTEISFFSKKKLIDSKSFKLGTVRLLQGSEAPNAWQEMEEWIKKTTKKHDIDYIIGSGGNINKLVKLSNERTGEVDKNISLEQLKDLFQHLNSFSYDERVSELELNPDRADVIIPASQIFLNVMEWGEIKKVYVPKIGLSDGLIKELYTNEDFPSASVFE